MQGINTENITVDQMHYPAFTEAGIEADVLRLDRIHAVVSGNKWFKLRYYLDDFKTNGKKGILTFGGAWSNHIIATAAVCKQYGIESIGVIRGEEAAELSPTLIAARDYDMQLYFISRAHYKQKQVPAGLPVHDYYIIPEGGYGYKGMEGAATILDLVDKDPYTHICCAAGTGTMTAGLLHASTAGQQVTAVSVLKNNTGLEAAIQSLQPSSLAKLNIVHDYSFDGYAKYTTGLLQFMNDFYRHTTVPSDFVYTGKLFYALADLALKGYFPVNSKLLLIHSGGLQGNASLDKGTLIF